MNTPLLWSSVLILCVTACDKKGGGSPAGSASAPPAAACAADEYASKEKVFCVKTPAGYKAEPETKNDPNIDILFKKDGAPSYRVFYRKDPGYEYTTWVGTLDEKADHIKVEKRDKLSGVKGEYVLRTTNSGAVFQFLSVVEGKGYILICDTSGSAKLPDDVIEACKSLKPHPG